MLSLAHVTWALAWEWALSIGIAKTVTWALTREWALARDTTVIILYTVIIRLSLFLYSLCHCLEGVKDALSECSEVVRQ